MRKIITATILAIAAICAPINARAYSQEMEQLAQILNGQDTSIQKVEYDGENLIFTFSPSVFNQDDLEMLNEIDDIADFQAFMAEIMPGEKILDHETAQLLSQILSEYHTNMKFRLPKANGQYLTLTFTPEELSKF